MLPCDQRSAPVVISNPTCLPSSNRAQFIKEAEAATGSVDPREYGFSKGWVRVQGNNIQLRGITDSVLRGVADNLYQAEDEAVLDQVFTVEDVATRRVFEGVPFEALEKGISGLAPYRAQYSLRPIKRSEMTPEMAKWSEGSKVVDENGDLLVVYHGTRRAFDEIGTEDERGFPITPCRGGLVASLSEEPKFTFDDAGVENESRILPMVLSIKRPFDFRDQAVVDDVLLKFGNYTNYGTNVNLNLGDTTFDGWQDCVDSVNIGSYDAIEQESFAGFLGRLGFDGVAIEENDSITYGIFNPNQAKGYFNERPTSSPNFMGSRRFDPFESFNEAMKEKGFSPEQRLRLISAASSMSIDDSVVEANPIDWLRALQKNKAARTSTPYNIADLNRTAGQNLDNVKTQRQAAGNAAELQVSQDFDPSEP
jgi:hypothetical protein